MKFSTWIDTFVSEKQLDTSALLEAEGQSGTNMIPLECLLDAVKSASASDQKQIKTALVRLDFVNAPVMPFFEHIAAAIAI